MVTPPEKALARARSLEETGWSAAGICAWLLTRGRLITSPPDLLDQLGRRLVEAECPVMRMRFGLRTLHPEHRALSFSWTQDGGVRGHGRVRHGVEQRDAFIGSPLARLHREGVPVRRVLRDLEEGPDHPVLHEIAAAGGTDYYALPLRFAPPAGGQSNETPVSPTDRNTWRSMAWASSRHGRTLALREDLPRRQCHAAVSRVTRVMVPRNPKGMAASVRQRLLNTSRATGEPFDLPLTRYGAERPLFRLGRSPWSREIVLKGAMLFATWHEIPMRPTRDVDLLGFGSPEVERLADIFRSICIEPVVDDGFIFDPGNVNADPIRETNAYHGVRIRLGATLAGAKIPLQVDVGFGDAVVPDPEEISFPTLLEFPAPTVRAYPIYTVISEKLQALTVLGLANSRMKDYYDLSTFATRAEIRGLILVAAIQATFERRETPIAAEAPLGLRPEFARDVEKVHQSKAFVEKIETAPSIPTLDEVVGVLRELLCPALDAASFSGEKFGQLWQPGGPWVRPFD